VRAGAATAPRQLHTRGETSDQTAVVLGRALHAPWNEGTRVITRNFARAVATRRPVRLVSMTDAAFRPLAHHAADEPAIEHVYTRAGYSLSGAYRTLPHLMRQLDGPPSATTNTVAHIFSLPLAIAPLLRRRGVAVVAHVMVAPLHPRHRVLLEASVRLFGRWIDAFAVTSRSLAPALAAWGVPASKVVHLPPAIDEALVPTGDRRFARRRLGLENSEAVIVYIGNMSPRRFPAVLVRDALQHAAQACSRPLRFVAISPGETYDGSGNTSSVLLDVARRAEHQLREARGVQIEVLFRNLDDIDKAAWLMAADAVVFPFRESESVEPPMTILEAMACGALVVASPAANRSGLVQSGKTGLLCESNARWGEYLSHALGDEAGATRMGQAARAVVLERFSYAAVADAAAQLWKSFEQRPAQRRRAG
jgi:glycosyltransferase involved in cell wall biosynthesis